jgi:NAD(P)-dependent dehydrogenase (short-subunit alcohol dehydrogenase family)
VSRAVLVTGCSTRPGISPGTGRATALRLHRAGWPVYATGRDVDALEDLAREGITTLRLDVTDEKSMGEVVDRITDEHGSVGVLVNNAATRLYGTLEETPIEHARQAYETNIFGTVRLTQLVLPGMREHGGGRIVMMSSLYGLFATPGRGFYQSTKHALEALSDSLRLEAGKFGVKIAVIEASPILGKTVPASVAELMLASERQTGLYDDFWEDFVTFHEPYRHVVPRGRGRLGVTAEEVARVVERAITARSPRPRYRVGLAARTVPRLRRTFGERGFVRITRVLFPVP